MAKKKQHALSKTEKVSIGVGLTAAAAAAAGAYFLYGSKNAPKNRKKVKSWMLKAKADVLETLERVEDITKDEYESLVDSVAKVYSTLQTASKGEISDFKKEMKANWKQIQQSGAVKKIARKAMKGAAKSAAKETGRQMKKAAQKKTAKKSTKRSRKSTKKTTK